MKPADTPEKLAALKTVTPFQLIQQTHNGKPIYFFADPDTCKCIFVGNQKAYDEFRKLAVKQEVADRHRAAAIMDQAMADNWDVWGPLGPWD